VKAHVFKKIDRLPEPPQRVTAPSVPSLIRTGAEHLEIAEQLVSLLAPASFAADQYRTLRHTVERLRKESGLQVLAVSSPTPSDGKTITTLNLAGALAQGRDARVIVMDADLRRPSVAEYLGLASQRFPGLAEAILDPKCSLSRTARHLERFNLSVVPAGSPQIASYELLNSPRFEDLLREARSLYDYVLIDTPPLVPLSDCRLIGRWVDGFLIVVGAHKTPRKLLSEALGQLDPSKVIGVVFNGDDRPLSKYYGYHHYFPHADDRHTARRR
jgi:capsular exopolysaccharide synthesis family protein